MNKTYGVTQISKKILMLLVNVLIALLSLFCLFPVVWMIYSSLKDEPSFLKNLIGLPTSLHFSNYLSAIKTGKMDVAFVNSVLEIDGIPNLNDQSKYPPLMARSFLHWGERVAREDIQRGDVVIFPRGNAGWKGHVGFYVDSQMHNGREYWIILGGNQSNEVRYDFYSPNRALGIRRNTSSS